MSILVTTYCERQEIAWTLEPLNTVSNLAFFILAIKLHSQSRKPGNKLHASAPAWYLNTANQLALLVLATGIGSASYHASPTGITLAMDAIPILMTTAFLCWLLLTRVCELNNRFALTLAVMLPVSTLFMSKFNHMANGSLFYFPVWLYLCGLLIYCRSFGQWPSIRKHRSVRLSYLLLISFSLALLARTIDLRICNSIPVGTHFFWHVFAAISIYLAYKLHRLHDDFSDF